jgi:hypothetical protein
MNHADMEYLHKHSTKGGKKLTNEEKKRKATDSIEERVNCFESETEREEETTLKKSLWSKTNANLQNELKTRGLPTSGTKKDMVLRLLTSFQREKTKALKKKEREQDPLKYQRWWNTSIIVDLFKWEARRLVRTTFIPKKRTKKEVDGIGK